MDRLDQWDYQRLVEWDWSLGAQGDEEVKVLAKCTVIPELVVVVDLGILEGHEDSAEHKVLEMEGDYWVAETLLGW